MNWKKWPKLLEYQWEILGKDYQCLLGLLKLKESHLDWGCAIDDFEDECREEVEEAIRQFASTGKWPLLSPIGGAMLLERLSFATGLMDELHWYAKQWKMGAPTKEMDEEETICWFLIDAWDKFGFDNLNCTVRAIPTRETEACRELGRKLKKDFHRPEDN